MFGGIIGKLVQVQGENMPENEDAPMVTVTGEVNDIEGEIRTCIPTVHSGAAVSGLSSILLQSHLMASSLQDLYLLCTLSL